MALLREMRSAEVENFILHRLGVFDNTSFDLVEVSPKKEYPPHRHRHSSAKFYMILGRGKIILGKRKIAYRPGDMFRVGKNVAHGFQARTPTLFLSVQKPPIKDQKTGKEDIEF